ncbi:uncharacterized protein N7479_008495 [Penicillium vulpinum]|uniref:uncharacterized protein n=1 Tax=Penicillium vulpinum TaxID=29845 RepID=UPI0025496864|nr:uncharacterized protein N7479_008495 [Penicillium vulpinum]KAJ5961345.1 hypothetical protein N7479_008495 [Penicillium vulpinum]
MIPVNSIQIPFRQPFCGARFQVLKAAFPGSRMSDPRRCKKHMSENTGRNEGGHERGKQGTKPVFGRTQQKQRNNRKVRGDSGDMQFPSLSPTEDERRMKKQSKMNRE